MNYFSMFSGIGGFELGIQRVFEASSATEQATKAVRHNANDTINTTQKRRQSATCIGYSEIDKYAIKVYERQFGETDNEHAYLSQKSQSEERPQGGVGTTDKQRIQLHDRDRSTTLRNRGHTNYGDATTINPNELPDFDLLVGGFPCQAFSVAGKRKGFNDTRGTLFFDIARILSVKRPRHLVLENVKGLLSHDSGKTFQTILGVLADLGYRVEWQVLNSKDFGVPQNRERVYFVGHLGGECGRQVFPITGSNGTSTKLIGRVDLNGHDYLKRVYSKDGASPTLPTKTGGGHIPKTAVRQPLRFLDRNQKNIEGDYSFTVDASQTSGVKVDRRIRRLTPKECERLQGFPDNWTKYGVGEEPISDTQRYKMCGNAVTVNVVEAVMKGLLAHV